MPTNQTGTGTAASRRTANRKAAAAPTFGSTKKIESLRLRLFEPERIKKELNLDSVIVKSVEMYEEFLAETFRQKPAQNKVVELLIEDSLENNAPFQTWKKQNTARANENNSAMKSTEEADDADKVLESLGDSKGASV